MFAVTVKLIVADGNVEGFLPLMRENATASLSDEPGCLRFDVCQHPDTPNEIFLYEIYQDAAAFEWHKGTPHYLKFSKATEHLMTSKTVKTYFLIGD